MINLESDGDHSPKGVAQIVRIEKSLCQELVSCSGFLGKIGQIYKNGFDLVKEDGRLIYFQGGKWLHSPFGAILDRPIWRDLAGVSLREGDAFYRNGSLLFREPGNSCSISLNGAYVVDLRRKLYLSPPGYETLLSLIQLLITGISRWGRFEGIAGTLTFLEKEQPDIFSPRSIPLGFWSKHALPCVTKLLESIVHKNFNLVEDAWEELLGLGPGLTPAGDDFMVGFLAAHKLFSSFFSGRLEDYDLKRKLKEKARIKTSPIAYQFLTCALEGVFSETLYLVFSELLSQDQLKEQEDRLHPEKQGTDQIEYFLKWGHSSGTDTLTGTVFGLWTMI